MLFWRMQIEWAAVGDSGYVVVDDFGAQLRPARKGSNHNECDYTSISYNKPITLSSNVTLYFLIHFAYNEVSSLINVSKSHAFHTLLAHTIRQTDNLLLPAHYPAVWSCPYTLHSRCRYSCRSTGSPCSIPPFYPKLKTV